MRVCLGRSAYPIISFAVGFMGVSGFAGVLLLSSARADSTESSPLSLPLEELTKVQVVTASKTKEDVQDSPGIVEVITQDDIQRLGAISVADVLDHATSLFSLGTAVNPMGLVSMRGDVAESSYMPRVLMLLDGRPFRDSLNGGVDAPLLFAMPLLRILRIEVVRGPGSVLYGTNAYIGVINIITRDAKDQNIVAQAEYGSYNTRYGEVAIGREVGDLKITAGGTVQATQGWNFNLVDEDGVQDSIPLGSFDGGGDINLEYHGLTLHNYVGFVNQSSVGEEPVWVIPNVQANMLRWISDLGYTRQLAKDWKGSFNLTYNMMRLSGFYPGDPAAQDQVDERSDDFLIETTHDIHLSNVVDLTVGGDIDVQTGKLTIGSLTSQGQPFNLLAGPNPDPLVAVPFYQRALYELYAQSEFHINDDLKFIAGGQLNKVPNLDVDLVPRLGALLSLESGFGSKLLFGQAYRNATGAENYIDEPGLLLGNNALKPETITTFEVQTSYQKKSYNVALTYFHSHQDNVISRTFPPPVPKTINEGTITSEGLELEGHGTPIRILTLTGGMTYEWLSATHRVPGGSEATFSNPSGMPLSQVKLGATVAPCDALRFSLFDNFFGRFGNINANDPDANPPVRSFHDVSLNLEYQATKAFKVNFSAKNILSEPIYYPEVLRHVINSIPGAPPIVFYGGITGTL
jgi:outer membrane receptor for ferrienterochelin and colicins